MPAPEKKEARTKWIAAHAALRVLGGGPQAMCEVQNGRAHGLVRWCKNGCVPDSPAAQVKRQIMDTLTLLKIDGAKNFTFKVFRTGKATAMAEKGDNLLTIKEAGERNTNAH